jgi:hypothetical protein
MTDNEVLAAVRDSLAGVHLDRPLETVVARGRGRRRQRRAAMAGTLVLAAGLAAALAGGLGGAAPPARPEASPPRLAAAWSVTSDGDGTITAVLRRPQDHGDPVLLQRALTDAGAPAIVRTGTCAWPQPKGYRGDGFWSGRTPEGGWTFRFRPSKLPPGAVVVFAIDKSPATGRPGHWTVISAGVMAAGGTVTCEP